MGKNIKFYGKYICNMREKGFSHDEIANVLGIAKEQVVYYCQKNYILKGKEGKEVYSYRYDIDKIKQLISEDKYLSEIIKETGLDFRVLNSILSVFNLSLTETAKERRYTKNQSSGFKKYYKTDKPSKTCSICYFCKNTNLHDCSWFNPDNPQPRDDWEAESVFFRHGKNKRQAFIVRKCGGFVAEKEEYRHFNI